MSDINKMVKVACEALEEKKGEDIRVIRISKISVMADYFVIASGNNPSQIQALVDNVEEKLGEAGFSVKRVEGNRSSTWILLDYGDLVVHIFDVEDRLFYDLERIWADGENIDTQSL